MKSYVGIDIGGTKCAVVAAQVTDGEITVTKKVKFPTTDFESTYARIFAEVEGMMPCDGIGISCGGPLDEVRGVIMSPPNLPDWRDVHITEELEERFGVKARLLNDANACAVAEWRFGAGRGSDNMIFLTFGTGMGAGLILGGRLYSGCRGMAGEVGHMRLAEDGPLGYGKRGSFEGFCSGGGIARYAMDIAREALSEGRVAFGADSEESISALTAAKIAELARLGDKDALAVFASVGKRLGQGLAILTDVLNPDRIIIGSIYQRCEDLLCEIVMRSLRAEALPEAVEGLSVLPSELGDSIGDIAAIAVAATNYN